jgi:predicted dehydrogenase
MHNLISRRTMLAAAVVPLRLPRKIRVGLAGMEGHTGEILTPMKSVPDLELVCVSDPNAKLLEKFPAGVRRYADYRQMLEKEKLDILAVCGPNHTRSEIILAGVSRKLHIAAEKPLAIDVAALHSIRDALRANSVQLTMLLPMRFYPHYMAMKQLAASGQLGEIAQVEGQKSYKLGERASWMKQRQTFGGSIPYVGVHMVDLMRFTTGREMVEASSFQSHIGYPDYGQMENTTGTVFRLDNGGVGLLHIDFLRPQTAPTHGDDRLRLVGTKGIAEYQGATGLTVITAAGPPRVVTPAGEPHSVFLDFLDSVYNGKPSGLPWSDIYRVNEIVLAARDAAEKHRIEKA